MIYKAPADKTSALALDSYLQGGIDNFEIAPIDLNNDGTPEFISRPKDCGGSSAFCDFSILAETDGEIIPLGRIQARDIHIDIKRNFGVRHIHAFDNPLNDFSYSLYVWDAAQSQYIVKE